MSGTPERDDAAEFEAAWARIVQDLTGDQSPDPSADRTPDQAADRTPDQTPDGRPATDPRPTSATDPGLAALFEPLRRAEAAADPAEDPAGDGPATGSRPNPAAASTPGADAPTGRRSADPEPDSWDDEGHFTPPPPPDLPEGTPLTRLAWVGTLGGPAILLLSALTGWDPPRAVTMGAGLAFLAGFSTLVWLLPEAREDGWDDGARL